MNYIKFSCLTHASMEMDLNNVNDDDFFILKLANAG